MMDQNKILINAEKKIAEVLGDDTSGHDLWHIKRVVALSKEIGKREGGDIFIIQLAAWLHDIADHKYNNGDHTVGPREAKKWMISQNLSKNVIDQVVLIIDEISFKGAEVKTPMSTHEGKVVQDADRLDAIGALGIARTFAYGGSKGHAMYEPDIKPVIHTDFESYKSSKAPVINHFYEKLLLLKDLMNTETGIQIAEERHRFMEGFLDQFYKEWKVVDE
jgi:uncharacterized protein